MNRAAIRAFVDLCNGARIPAGTRRFLLRGLVEDVLPLVREQWEDEVQGLPCSQPAFSAPSPPPCNYKWEGPRPAPHDSRLHYCGEPSGHGWPHRCAGAGLPQPTCSAEAPVVEVAS